MTSTTLADQPDFAAVARRAVTHTIKARARRYALAPRRSTPCSPASAARHP